MIDVCMILPEYNYFIVILWDYFYDFHSKFCSISYVHKKKKKTRIKRIKTRIKRISFGTLYQSPADLGLLRKMSDIEGLYGYLAQSLALSSVQTPAAAIQNGQQSMVRSLQRPLSATGVL